MRFGVFFVQMYTYSYRKKCCLTDYSPNALGIYPYNSYRKWKSSEGPLEKELDKYSQ